MKKQIKYCSIELRMRDGEKYWVDDFIDAELSELERVIEDYLIANPEVNREEISEIILTT